MKVKKVSLENILATLFLIIAGIVFWVLSLIEFNIFNFDFFWESDINYITLFVVGIFLTISSIFIFLKNKIGFFLSNIPLVIMMIVLLNKSIAVGIFRFENKNNPTGYIAAFLVYLALFLVLNSKRFKLRYKIKNIEVLLSVLLGIIISIPFTMNFWAWFNLLNK